MRPLITVQELFEIMSSDEPPLIADCRFALGDPEQGECEYLAGHLPGAHYLHLDRDLSGALGSSGGRHPLPAAADFQALMRDIGLNTGTLLVACDDGAAMACRLWWLARYFGHDEVAVLDGGVSAWRTAGLPLHDHVSERPGSGDFVARERPDMVVDFEQLRALSDSASVLVDSRDEARYRGEVEPIDPKAGHIPGACNAPFAQALEEDGRFRSVAEQIRRWGWLDTEARPVLYCGSGVTACVNLLSLQLAGRDDGQLYAGSWSDWCQHEGEVATSCSAE